MKINKQTIIFYFLLFFTLLCAFLSFKFINFYPKYNVLNVALETLSEKQEDILFKVDSEYYIAPKFKNVLSLNINKKIDSFEILVDENYTNEIKNIIVFNDIKLFYFKDFSNFKKDSEKICKNDVCKIYKKYIFRDDIKFNKNSKYINYNSKLNSFYSFKYCVI